jgi:hypothetical protein
MLLSELLSCDWLEDMLLAVQVHVHMSISRCVVAENPENLLYVGAKILTFFSLIGPRKFNVTVTRVKLVHFMTLRHPSPE